MDKMTYDIIAPTPYIMMQHYQSQYQPFQQWFQKVFQYPIPASNQALTLDNVIVLFAGINKYAFVSEDNITLPDIDISIGNIVDLSHARAKVRFFGYGWRDILHQFIGVDFSSQSFLKNHVVLVPLHHVAVQIHCPYDNDNIIDMYIPSSFHDYIEQLLNEISK